jgi:hypothetical protein
MNRCARASLAGLVLAVAFSAPVRAVEVGLIDFSMKDQFDREYRDADFRGEIVCLIGSDKDGSRFNRLWSQAIADSIAPGDQEAPYKVLPVAHLKGVPFFLKGFIKGKFPKDEKTWILMDWKGRFTEAYSFAPGESNILVFDREGKRVLRVHGKEPDGERLTLVVEKLRRLLAADAP